MGEPINLVEQIDGKGCLKTLGIIGTMVTGTCLLLYSMDRYQDSRTKAPEKQESPLEREARLKSYSTTYSLDVNDDGVDDFVVEKNGNYTAYLREDWAESKPTELSDEQWKDIKNKLIENYRGFKD